MDLICTVPRPYLLGRALIWPGYFGATTFGHPSSSLKSAGFVSPAWKFSLVSICDAILFPTIHSMFIYRWSSNFVETLSWKESNGGRDAISCLLPCVLYCMEGEFEQIISKIRLSKGQQQLTAE